MRITSSVQSVSTQQLCMKITTLVKNYTSEVMYGGEDFSCIIFTLHDNPPPSCPNTSIEQDPQDDIQDKKK